MNFSSNFFWIPHLIRCFRDLHVRKFRKFSPDHFYDENFQFYEKKDFRPGMEITSETTILGITSETTETWDSGALVSRDIRTLEPLFQDPGL